MTNGNELLGVLRRGIFAAEIKVALDKELGRKSSSAVKRLAAVKLPPVLRANKPSVTVTVQGTFHLMSTDGLLRTLRREVFAAEMKVVLDKELGRETSPTVRKLAGMKMPPITSPHGLDRV